MGNAEWEDDSWEWVYYEEEECLACQNQVAFEDSAYTTAANSVIDSQARNSHYSENGEWEYYDE